MPMLTIKQMYDKIILLWVLIMATIDSIISGSASRIDAIDNRLRTLEKLVSVVSDETVAIGFQNAYVTFSVHGEVTITGYAKQYRRLVTVSLDQIINKL